MSMLEVREIGVAYRNIQVIWDVNLRIDRGEVVGLFGPNGAGKSTLLRTVIGINKPIHGEILFNGERINEKSPREIALMGISYVPEGKRVFPNLTVYDNLVLGAVGVSGKAELRERLQEVYEVFPWLKERERQMAGTLSGGEMQMLTIARGLMSKPKILMLDEPSFGVAPIYVKRIFDTLKGLNERTGLTILLVEQNVRQALRICNRGYILESGRIVLQGDSETMENNEYVREAYLGI